ncbi:MAG: cyclic nucleotide-binding domain-containing protein [Bacteriovoracaceae bacterium]|nr:cyclic nucleotide-binding domain-containing protein [Bacteriovoracaceae bacterium]
MSLALSLKSSPLFHDILEEEIDLFLKGQKIYSWSSGDCPCIGGSPIEAFYIIMEGKADLVYQSWGREFLMQELIPWDHFGEVLFSNDQVHPYSVISKTDLTCLRIDFNVFKGIFEKNPEVYALFMNNLLRVELSLKKQALGLVARLNESTPIQIGLPLYNRRTKRQSPENEEEKESA